jgi:UDP-glucuronate decarboxylase
MHPKDGRVVSNFIVQALKGEDITIVGNGIQTRSFQYVSDLTEGMHCMMQSRDGFTGPVNIGNLKEFTVLEFAKEVLDLMASKSKLVHLPSPQDDTIQRKTDIYLAKRTK